MIVVFFVLISITLILSVVLTLTLKRMQDYRQLRLAVEKIDKLEHATLDPQVDRRLRAQFNRNINVILSQFRVAEQRGLDWEKAVDSIADSLCIVDEGAKIVRANRTFANRLGMEVQDLLGQNVSKFICDQKDRACPINRAVKANGAFEQFIEKSRLGRAIQLTVTPTRTATKQRRFVVIARETQQISDSLSGLREILNAQQNPAVIADPKSGKILEVNTRFIETFEISSPGIYVDELLSSDRTLDKMKLEQTIALGGKESLSFYVGKAGHQQYEISSVMRRDQAGQPKASLVLMSPVPANEDHKELENLLTPNPYLAGFSTIPLGEIN